MDSLLVKAREGRGRGDAIKTMTMVKDAKFHNVVQYRLRQKPVILAIVGGVKPAEGLENRFLSALRFISAPLRDRFAEYRKFHAKTQRES
jgi:hypothetical protein